MIENAIQYTGEVKTLVDKYNKSKVKSPDTWSQDEYTPVRKFIKNYYLDEQNYTCPFCKQKYKVKNNRAWDIEHIVSKATHPDFLFEPNNLCVSCPDCNNEKRDKSVLDRDNRKRFPARSGAYKVVHPHFDQYEDHLTLLAVGHLYQWKTKKGRTTYQIYGLDRFLVDAGRSRASNPNDYTKKLMASALCSDDDEYKKREIELLRELVLKNSDRIGSENTVTVLRNID